MVEDSAGESPDASEQSILKSLDNSEPQQMISKPEKIVVLPPIGSVLLSLPTDVRVTSEHVALLIQHLNKERA